MAFKEKLRELRTENKLTQKQLAIETGYVQSVISDWESGVSAPTLPALLTLAFFFGVDLNELTDFEQELSNSKKHAQDILP
ncbi:MAG: helix-turn-helix domain-containing protein [Clostridiales bacterium]|jgi:transcriptional regulator with XRE-family HTH domain|nr:helix-turn-helix domain-containing protein [Clostridiales bacterium]